MAQASSHDKTSSGAQDPLKVSPPGVHELQSMLDQLSRLEAQLCPPAKLAATPLNLGHVHSATTSKRVARSASLPHEIRPSMINSQDDQRSYKPNNATFPAGPSAPPPWMPALPHQPTSQQQQQPSKQLRHHFDAHHHVHVDAGMQPASPSRRAESSSHGVVPLTGDPCSIDFDTHSHVDQSSRHPSYPDGARPSATNHQLMHDGTGGQSEASLSQRQRASSRPEQGAVSPQQQHHSMGQVEHTSSSYRAQPYAQQPTTRPSEQMRHASIPATSTSYQSHQSAQHTFNHQYHHQQQQQHQAAYPSAHRDARPASPSATYRQASPALLMPPSTLKQALLARPSSPTKSHHLWRPPAAALPRNTPASAPPGAGSAAALHMPAAAAPWQPTDSYSYPSHALQPHPGQAPQAHGSYSHQSHPQPAHHYTGPHHVATASPQRVALPTPSASQQLHVLQPSSGVVGYGAAAEQRQNQQDLQALGQQLAQISNELSRWQGLAMEAQQEKELLVAERTLTIIHVQACSAVAARQSLNAYDIATEEAAAERVSELRAALPGASGVKMLSSQSELLDHLSQLRQTLQQAQVNEADAASALLRRATSAEAEVEALQRQLAEAHQALEKEAGHVEVWRREAAAVEQQAARDSAAAERDANARVDAGRQELAATQQQAEEQARQEAAARDARESQLAAKVTELAQELDASRLLLAAREAAAAQAHAAQVQQHQAVLARRDEQERTLRSEGDKLKGQLAAEARAWEQRLSGEAAAAEKRAAVELEAHEQQMSRLRTACDDLKLQLQSARDELEKRLRTEREVAEKRAAVEGEVYKQQESRMRTECDNLRLQLARERDELDKRLRHEREVIERRAAAEREGYQQQAALDQDRAQAQLSELRDRMQAQAEEAAAHAAEAKQKHEQQMMMLLRDRDRQRDATKRVAELEASLANVRGQLAAVVAGEQRRAAAAAARDAQAMASKRSRSPTAPDPAAARQAEQRVQDAERRLAAAQDALRQSQEAEALLTRRVEELQEQLTSHSAEHQREVTSLSNERSRLRGVLGEAERQLAALRTDLGAVTKTQARLKEHIKDKQQLLDNYKSRNQSLQAELDHLRTTPS